MHVPHTRLSPPPQSPLALAKATHVPRSQRRRAVAQPPPWESRPSDNRCKVYWTSMCPYTPARHCTKPIPRSRGEQVSNGLAHSYEGMRWACLLGQSVLPHTASVLFMYHIDTHTYAFAVVPWPFPYRRVEKTKRRSGEAAWLSSACFLHVCPAHSLHFSLSSLLSPTSHPTHHAQATRCSC